MAANDPETFDAKSLPWTRSPDYRSFYVNNVALATSTHDIQVRFAQLTADGTGSAANIELATVFMSPSQAKATALLLLRAVLTYEEQHKIKLPIPEHLEELLTEIRGAKASKK
jgi:hypothetical protein